MADALFLSSLESIRLEPVREVRVHRVIAFDSGKSALLADISPGVNGQDFDRVEDIGRVVLTARHEGVEVDRIVEYPCFVFVAVPPEGLDDLRTPVSVDDLQIIGWGELYRTADDAAAHRFG